MPRTVALAIAAVLALPAAASASTLMRDGDGTWLHQHTRDYTYAITPGVPDDWATVTRLAAADWDRSSHVLSLTETSGGADIVVRAAHLGDDPAGHDFSTYHGGALILYNLDRYDAGSLSDTLTSYSRSLACHELGHALGLGHGGDGCMAVGSEEGEQRSALSGLLDVDRLSHPGADDVALLDEVYPATGH